MDVISKKWALITVRAIGVKTRVGYNELMKTLGNVSPTTLSSTLKELERDGLVSRKVVDTAPIRVQYSLTREGQELRKMITPLLEWASLRHGRILTKMKSR